MAEKRTYSAPICGNCGKERLVRSIMRDGEKHEPKGNVGICPECKHADVLDFDKHATELTEASKSAN